MYAFGAAVRLTQEVRASGVLTAPATVTLTILLPDGTDTGALTPVNDGTGLYHYDYTSAQAGRHVARWVTVGPVGADEESFDVAPMWGEAGIVSVREAKKQLNLDAADTDDDEEVAGVIRAVTEPIERIVGAVARRPVVETHDGGYALALRRAPALSVTSAVAARTGVLDQGVADLELNVSAGIVRRRDGAWMAGPLRITYLAGRADVPAHVRQAALIIIQHMWETQRGQMGGVRRGGSDEVYDPRFGFSIPRRAQELLGDQPGAIA